jgi:hypothetical protein
MQLYCNLMQCILHIGTGKTGTTTLQRFFRHNASSLASFGVHIPITVGHHEHVAIPNYAMDAEKGGPLRRRTNLLNKKDVVVFRERFEQSFLAEMSQSRHHTFILSSERCWSGIDRIGELQRLKNLLSKVASSTQVVVYLRPQHEVATSLYTTRLKNGTTSKLILPAPKDASKFYDYYDRLNMWEDVFGRKNVSPRLFTPVDLIEGDICTDFMRAFNLPLDGCERSPRANESLSVQGQIFLRRFNECIPRYTRGRKVRFRGSIYSQLSRIASGRGILPSRSEAQAFFEHFAEINEAVRCKWFPERGVLFEPDFLKFPEQQSQCDLSVDEAFGIFAKLWRRKHVKDLRARTYH